MLLHGAYVVFVRTIKASHLLHNEILGEDDTSGLFADFFSFDIVSTLHSIAETYDLMYTAGGSAGSLESPRVVPKLKLH